MGECAVCRDTVTNPVCPECLRTEIGSWLSEVKPDLLEGFDDCSDELSFVLFGDEKCILCRKGMDVCTYCYTNHVFNWLKKRAPKVLLKEFITFFNFDEGRRGYLQEAERLGIYE